MVASGCTEISILSSVNIIKTFVITTVRFVGGGRGKENKKKKNTNKQDHLES